jgi:hypothetical protein
MKGQIFILASVMILIALLLLQNAIRPVVASPKSDLFQIFSNIRAETIRTVDMSLLNGGDVSANLNNFIEFSQEIMKKRGYTQIAIYSVSNMGGTTIVNMNLTLSAGNSFIQDEFIINRTVYS